MKTSSPSLSSHQVLLYYLYTPIEAPEEYAERHRLLCQELELRGRIIIGTEGINGTVSGTRENTDRYIEAMHADPVTEKIEFKIDPSDEHTFPKLSVKVRDEIVRLGLPGEKDIDPNELTGERLSPSEFYAKMQEENTVIIDGRNDYEAKLGHFKGAVCPPIRNFREFPEWLDENRDELEGKKLLTYCTGGIRCEKLSGFLKREGFDDVYQLDGGIVKYGKDPEVQGRDFEGLCYVFDERVEVEVNHTDTKKVITHCRHCGKAFPHYGNCKWPECNEQIIVCSDCRESFGLFCGEECRSHAEASAG